jgi:transglutaminase-like putative cysteine protease
MKIRIGFKIRINHPQPTPMLAMLNVHYTRVSHLLVPDYLISNPAVPVSQYRDSFGNWCTRVLAPAGALTISTDAIIFDPRTVDHADPSAVQHDVTDLPDECLQFLLGSRYCETDLLMQMAWELFANIPPGWSRVQAICDFVHNHLTFGYQYARNTRTAYEAYHERVGVCRDFAHLAVTFCRCMNIPARYCTGYLGDIGVPPDPAPMDFSAWFEVYIGGHWHTFDARHNIPRIGRVLIARGRDAADIAISTHFGPSTLESFEVWTDEVIEHAAPITVATTT